MNIISGQARGIKLDVPKGLDVRPTSIRAKKALFDSLGAFTDCHIIDLFAGSGAIGLEAASRGADRVTFIEKNRKHCQFIERNIAKITKAGVQCEFQIIKRDVTTMDFAMVPCQEVDYIFADPPYALSGPIFEQLSQSELFCCFPKDCTLIWELPDQKGDKDAFMKTNNWKRINQRRFGGTDFLYLQRSC